MPETSSHQSAEPVLILPENRFAWTALQGTVSPASTSPLVYLYGPAGCGKSHLLRDALRQRLVEQPDCRWKLCTAALLNAEFSEAAEKKRISDFQAAYRQLDFFGLEDIQSLQHRPETQKQLLAILDSLQAREAAVVLSCNRVPGDLPEFLPKLRNRFRGGILALVKPPGSASRERLLEHFAARAGVRIAPAAIKLLAARGGVSPRELQGMVQQFEREGQSGKEIGVPQAEAFLRGELPQQQIPLAELARVVARHFNVSLAQLRSRSRVRGLVIPRQCAMLLARELTSERLERIGKYFDGRDHSTVVHACQRMSELAANQPEIRQHLAHIRQTLGIAYAPDQEPLPLE